MADIEEVFAQRVEFLPMPGGATLIVYDLNNDRRVHLVLNSVVLDNLVRQLSQSNAPPSHNDSAQ